MAHILSSVTGAATDQIQIKRVLISVSDKTNLIPLAKYLSEQNVEILSTGGTATAMRNAGIPVIDVSEYTQSPEILDGRVKTLHPKVHGALLGVRGNEIHEREMLENGIQKIDLVVMNLYPFEATVASGAEFQQCIENIDIGGPSMLRSAAKNHSYVAIVTNPNQYEELLSQLQQNNCATTLTFRKKLAASAFRVSAAYDSAISSYFSMQLQEEEEVALVTAPVQLNFSYKHAFNLKYGCNPHQKPAGIYTSLSLHRQEPFRVVSGTPGYINLLDACNAWQLVREAQQALHLPAAASFKHCSPAGAAVGIPLTPIECLAYERREDGASLTPIACAYVRARNADPMCSFGDFVAISDIVDECTAKVLKTEVCDGIIAPGYEPAALEILKAKKKGAFIVLEGNPNYTAPPTEFREVMGVGFYQKRNDIIFSENHLQKIVTQPTSEESNFSLNAQRDLILASIAIKYTQSNSVGYALNGQLVGVGAGQQSRVDCVKLAGRKVTTWYLRQHPKVLNLSFKSTVKRQDRVNARVRYIEGDILGAEYVNWIENFEVIPEPLTHEEKTEFMKTLTGVSLASDAFFPFRDSIDHAAKVGVSFVAQPGGSVADQEVITACQEYQMMMAFTELRLFHH